MTAAAVSSAGPVFRCSDAARERVDPLVGTAPRPRRWLLVEHPGPWPVDAVAGSGLDPAVLAGLQDAAAATTARILLVRRPGAAPARTARARAARAPSAADLPSRAGSTSTTRSWFVTDSAPGGGVTRGTWTRDDDLSAAAAALASPTPPGPADPLLLVCTHGRHDTCCAVRGRPVAAALVERWPEATWECSHVGGDRFAANVVVLPDGWYYGGLDADAAVAAVGAHLDGAVDPRFVRGMTTEPAVAQAAVVAAMAQRPPAAAGSLRSTSVRQVGRHRWEVDLHPLDAGSGATTGAVTATVEASTAPEAALTCRALRPSAATRWEVVDLRRTSGAQRREQDAV